MQAASAQQKPQLFCTEMHCRNFTIVVQQREIDENTLIPEFLLTVSLLL